MESSTRKPCPLPTPQSTQSFWHTQPSSLLLGHRTTRSLPKQADVVIVGSGMTGASIAHHLLHKEDAIVHASDRPSVVMLEAREACWGATGRNGGHCQPLLFEHPNDPAIGRFELQNYYTIKQMTEKRNIDCEFVAQPGVRGIYDRDILADTRLRYQEVQDNAPDLARLMRIVTDKAELAKLRHPHAHGAMVTSIAGRMWPYKLVSYILEQLLIEDHDGKFNLQTLTPVTKVTAGEDGRWTVQTDRGPIDAGAVILATNAYTSHLIPSFADLIVPARAQMSALSPPAALSGANRLKTSFGFEGRELDDYLIQRPADRGEHLMFGGGRDHGPSVGVADDSVIDDTVADYLRTRLPKVFDLPESELKVEKMWTGVLGWSKDGVPFVGPVPEQTGLYMAAGFTGHGMPNTWLSGKAVALMWAEHERGAGDATAIKIAQDNTGLPSSYVLDEKRLARVSLLDDVEVQEKRKVGRCELKTEHSPSGYA